MASTTGVACSHFWHPVIKKYSTSIVLFDPGTEYAGAACVSFACVSFTREIPVLLRVEFSCASVIFLYVSNDFSLIFTVALTAYSPGDSPEHSSHDGVLNSKSKPLVPLTKAISCTLSIK